MDHPLDAQFAWLRKPSELAGYFFRWLAWVGPKGRVIAFEPNTANVAYLRRHLSLDNVDIVEATVSDREGTAFFSGEVRPENCLKPALPSAPCTTGFNKDGHRGRRNGGAAWIGKNLG